ncbi:MAG: SUMF1/EgtB/PvdO family nonheme iron enzyme [Alphaproteobacteria bacterium]|nr:SUMF1/EgtB/PvdO family nonheme iron enzyme [Alphaproteobacteria bacterium]
MTSAQALLAMLITLMANAAMAQADPGMVPETITIPAGEFIAGSDQAERDGAYDLDQAAYGHDRTRKWGWYDDERPRRRHHLPTFAITRTTITNRQYAAFIAATGHPTPDVSQEVWRGYGLIHPYQRTRRHAWRDRQPPPGRGNHPVVLVSHRDAMAYVAWLSGQGVGTWRLPDELEWEKAARGRDGRHFPWGDDYNAKRLNSHDAGPFDTLPVGGFVDGASPFGLLDAAGQVFEWTASQVKQGGGGERYLVKGGSWDDKGCGVCRPAARHGRPAGLKHILIGFRLIRE